MLEKTNFELTDKLKHSENKNSSMTSNFQSADEKLKQNKD